MSDYAPMALTRNPFDPVFVDPNDLLTVSVAGRIGFDHLRDKLTTYEAKLNSLSAADIKRHSVCVMGPSKGGRSTFISLLLAKLDNRLAALGINPSKLYRYGTHPQTQINEQAGPNAALKSILRGLLIDMRNDSQGRFNVQDITEAFTAVVGAKELGDISNAFVTKMDIPLSGLQDPLILVFENLNSAGLYGYLRDTFFSVPCINVFSTYSTGTAGAEFQSHHEGDRLAWWTSLDPADFEEILALTEHNLNRARSKNQSGVFPFEQGAIEGFFTGGVGRQPMGRLMSACFHSIEIKAAQLELNAAAPIAIRHQDMQDALKRQ